MSASAFVRTSPSPERRTAPVRILTVGITGTDHHKLRVCLRDYECTFLRAHGSWEAVDLVRRHQPDVVLCEPALVGGTWKDLLSELQREPNPPKFIVCSLLADDRLWSEVLNLGGYDVLLKPFDPTEVSRIVVG
jgi:DNA-binding response OmpR family regulator